MDDRLNLLISEIRQNCEKANCYEFDFHWEVWGVMWYPWFIDINGKNGNFSLNDVSNNDLEKLCDQGLIELIKEYSEDEKHEEEFDKKRYRLSKEVDLKKHKKIEEVNVNDEIKVNSIILDTICSKCNSQAAKIEIVEPNAYPQDSSEWSSDKLERYKRFRDFDSYYLVYSGPGGSNGQIGNSINSTKVLSLIDTFTKPYDIYKIRDHFYDLAGFCMDCEKFYCEEHWNISYSGSGICPKGHFRSMDPHWSPD